MRLNYYDVLGVLKHAKNDDIKTAYRRLARKYHPDRNQNSKSAEELFKQVQIAYDHLSNPLKRQEHDEYLMGLRPESEHIIFAERGVKGNKVSTNIAKESVEHFSFDKRILPVTFIAASVIVIAVYMLFKS